MPYAGVRCSWVNGNQVYYDAAGNVVLHLGVGNVPLTTRVRATIAEVNAGLELLPALAGFAYRLVDAALTAVGGAVAAVTTIDILATQAAGSVKLVAGAQASMTQSTVLHAGESGAAVLADGASFVANDANTAITLGKTGSDVTTATHVDVVLTYAIEAA